MNLVDDFAMTWMPSKQLVYCLVQHNMGSAACEIDLKKGFYALFRRDEVCAEIDT